MTEYFICILVMAAVAIYKDYQWFRREEKEPRGGVLWGDPRADWEIYLWFRITFWSAVIYVFYRILFYIINYVLSVWGF